MTAKTKPKPKKRKPADRKKPESRPVTAAVPEPPKVITAYKGFDEHFRCLGFQFEIGRTYTHDGEVIPCQSGFHACTRPSDIWSYYGPAFARFALVELSGLVVPHSDDSKHAAQTIRILEEIPLASFMKMVIADVAADAKAQVSEGNSSTAASAGHSSRAASAGHSSRAASAGYSSRAASAGNSSRAASAGNSSTAASAGNSSTAASSGDSSRAASAGHSSTAASAGHSSTAASSGDSSRAASAGHSSTAASAGYSSRAASAGNSSTAASAGNSSRAASSGDSSRAASAGNSSTAGAEGKDTVAMVAGIGGRAKAGDNGCFALCWNDGARNRVVTGYVGEDGIEADTWYRIENGKLVEAE